MTQTTLKIDGMACSMCESHINEALRNAFDIKKVSSSRSAGETVIISDNELDKDKIINVIASTGYEVKAVSSETYQKKTGLFGKLRHS